MTQAHITQAHSETVHSQFDPQAEAYLHSAVHAAGPDLRCAAELVARHVPRATARVLDVGCGAGHLGFALAPAVAELTALDPSSAMRATVAGAAAQRGLSNIRLAAGSAESLPFDDAGFCVVATRYSAHHWIDLPGALREMRRVLKPGGYLLVIDIEGCADALADTHLQAIELLRDRSHIRNRSAAEWTRLIEAAGFAAVVHRNWPTRLEFSSWVQRMKTPQDRVAMIRSIEQQAPREVQQALAIEPDGSFSPLTGLWWARAA